MTGTRIIFGDTGTIYRHSDGTPYRFKNMTIDLSREDSEIIAEYMTRIEGSNRTADWVLSQIFKLGISKARQCVSLDKYLDERCDAEASE